jgi:hypothetical protein
MGDSTMPFRYRAVAALILATCVASCGDSNPFVGKWVLADDSKTDACMKALEDLVITEKSLRSKQGVWLYTLVEDGDEYIIDRNKADKILATVGPKDKDTVTLNFGPYQCRIQHPKVK